MAQSPGRLGDNDATDRGSLSEDLAALYRGDARRDMIDVDAGWKRVRGRLGPTFVPRRARAFVTAAAAVALAASILVVLRARSDTPTSELTPASSATPRAAATAEPDSDFRSVVAELERALRAGRSRLRPETARAIDGSLATIDRATHDAEAALAADPTDAYVADWLDAMRRRKVTALRQAVSDLGATF